MNTAHATPAQHAPGQAAIEPSNQGAQVNRDALCCNCVVKNPRMEISQEDARIPFYRISAVFGQRISFEHRYYWATTLNHNPFMSEIRSGKAVRKW